MKVEETNLSHETAKYNFKGQVSTFKFSEQVGSYEQTRNKTMKT